MKQFFLCLCYFTLIQLPGNAQASKQLSIQTESGLIHVFKTSDGRDMIAINIANWDKMVAGTKYVSRYLSASARNFCIEIASKKDGFCNKGIGFGCSIFDCPYVPDPLPNKVNNENRVCAVSVKKLKGMIRIVFIDHVDWKSLGE